MKKFFMFLCAVALVLVAMDVAGASLVLDLNLTQPLGTVSPTQTIRLEAILTNSIISTENLVIDATGKKVIGGTLDNFNVSGSIGSSPGTLDVYSYDFGPIINSHGLDYFTQFSNVNLTPGDSLSFTHGFFIPPPGGAPPGTYSGPFSFFLYPDPGVEDPALHARNNYEFNVVPIPGAVWLLGSGLIGLVSLRRKFKK